MLTQDWNWWLFGTLILLVSAAVVIVVQVEGRASTAERRASRAEGQTESRGPTAEARSISVPLQLPPQVAHFSGRQGEIDELMKVLDPQQKSFAGAAIVALSGKGGVGKTALGLRLAHLLAPSYPDGQLYVDLRGADQQPVESTDAIAGFLRALGVDADAMPSTLEDRQNLFRSMIATRRILLVLDNAASASQVRPLLPGGDGCAVIVTSRQPLGALETAAHLAVEVLSAGDAIELLTQVLGRDRTSREPEALQEMARLCGGLPLALRVAGGRLLIRRHWTLADMVRLLSDGHRRLHALKVGDLEVRASFSVSYEAQDQRHKRAFRMLGLLNFVDFPGWTAAAVLDEEPFLGAEVLESLCEAQLLEIAGRTISGQIRYRFHDLIRDFARDFSLEHDEPQARRDAVSRVLAGYLSLAERADAMLEPGVRNIDGDTAPRWPDDNPEFIFKEIAGDPQGWFAVERSNLVTSVEQASENELFKLTWELAGFFAAFFAVRIYPKEWEHTHLLAIAACEASDDLRGEAFTRRSLGRLHRYQARWDEARQQYLRAHDLFRRFHDRLWEGVVYRNLGDLNRDLGEYRAAESDLDRALTIFRELGDQQWEAATLISLGATYLSQGKADEAIECFRRCVPIFESGGHIWWRAVALVEIGDAYASLSRNAEAEQFLGEGLQIFQDLGDERRTALTQLSLGRLWSRQADRRMAIAVLEQCLKTFRLVGDRLCAARALDAIGDVYAVHGLRRRARGHWQESAEILDAIKAPELAQLTVKLGRNQG